MLNDEDTIESLPRITSQWLAGFFDGDGGIFTWINSEIFASVGISLDQKDIRILSLISLKYNSIGGVRTYKSNKGTFCSTWKVVARDEVKILLADILPYVIIKKRVVEKAYELVNLEYLTDYPSLQKRMSLLNDIRKLNKEGNNSGPKYSKDAKEILGNIDELMLQEALAKILKNSPQEINRLISRLK